ncbi:MAG TPA: polysaccharide lyase 6 family protein [Flavisolibacter sp.]|nr:polysaccharide lyase 6 family protein [Flavisolibacter sp.]
MKRLIAFAFFILTIASSNARNIPVKNLEELKGAISRARPGDTIVLQNGSWKDASISIDCAGTAAKPIVFKAQTAGKVVFSGASQLRLGGSYIVVDGLLFAGGAAPGNAVIEFRTSRDKVANHCRVTNCAIDDFNKPGRMDEDQWVAFYGRHNRLDHCSFHNKTNMGVLLAVMLDDEKSRENFHSIDHNYFGKRPPLASNGGEIIRVGVSQHCQFNSNTQITDNFFEHCDGEAEVVSIKSGSNVIRGNVLKECQGSVVLRHGDNNTVENNIFLGNGKAGTGGIRIINRGQWVVNNLFYKCRGTAFRSPMAIMNGIPNSPAHRYVQVTDAVVMNNSFFQCSPISFCEGSDAERTLPPDNVVFANNIFYNTIDSLIYRSFDDTKGFRFSENKVSAAQRQPLSAGFEKASLTVTKADTLSMPFAGRGLNKLRLDSLRKLAKGRVGALSPAPGFAGTALVSKLFSNASANCGAKWFKPSKQPGTTVFVSCSTPAEIKHALANIETGLVVIDLLSSSYEFAEPLDINGKIRFRSALKDAVRFTSAEGRVLPFLFQVKGGGQLQMAGLAMDLSGLRAKDLIVTDTSGSSKHSSITVSKCSFLNFDSKEGSILRATKSTICDSIQLAANSFVKNSARLLSFDEETDKKGYYNTEKLVFINNYITDHTGSLLTMLRGGNDESTMGPNLMLTNNAFTNCRPRTQGQALISLTGTQQSLINHNRFTSCDPDGTLILFEDTVRAVHLLQNNTITGSGKIVSNQFVTSKNNTIK